MDLHSPVQYVKGVGPRRAADFERNVRSGPVACDMLFPDGALTAGSNDPTTYRITSWPERAVVLV